MGDLAPSSSRAVVQLELMPVAQLHFLVVTFVCGALQLHSTRTTKRMHSVARKNRQEQQTGIRAYETNVTRCVARCADNLDRQPTHVELLSMYNLLRYTSSIITVPPDYS